jgi:predicted permease
VPAGQPIPERDTALFVGADPAFFATLQIPLISGRVFADRDSAASSHVAIVNERFAQRQFRGRNPVGEHLAAKVRGETRDLEIVGIVKNTNTIGLRAAPPSIVYVPYAQLSGDFPTTLEVRVTRPIGEMTAVLEALLREKLPGSPIALRTLSAQVDATTVQERLMATLATGFGVLALVLACVGLYGLLAYSVVRRTREIGIRMALGARRGRVVAMVLGGAFRLTSVGLVAGLVAATFASRSVASMLFGVTPADPAALAGATLALVAAALLAAWLPARRASVVNPLEALRHE